jgi:predicted DNA-binding transcriptional regulator YafY
LYRGEAVVRLSPRGLRLLFLLGPVVSRAAQESAGPPDAAGWTRVVLPIESIEHAQADLLRLGGDAEVLAPPELRRQMAETAAAMVQVYRTGS